jgi:hypothetical protein
MGQQNLDPGNQTEPDALGGMVARQTCVSPVELNKGARRRS